MTLKTASSRHFGLTIRDHQLERPWDGGDESKGTFSLFARELVPDGGEGFPVLVYFQGGPGFPAPRPVDRGGLIGEALKRYRVILLDQRGTGRSSRIDGHGEDSLITGERLALLRQEHIVADAEALREALGIKKWSLYGQSFGGFCITSYLSLHPDSVDEAYLTGGLPSTDTDADEVYRATFAKLEARQERFFGEYPWASESIREIAHHLDNSVETLPTGERLSSRRFRTLGIELGRGNGFHTLAYLLEDPFRTVRGEKRLKTNFLASAGAALSFEQGPLYAAIHESIYGGVATSAPTNWSAHRIREEIEGFEEAADPRGRDKFYLTGEHIFPWQFDEDPALHAFKGAANELAQRPWEASPYDRDALATAPPIAAAVYFDDIFVPLERSLSTARAYRDARLHVTNQFQHDGIRHDGAGIFELLREKLRDH